MKEKQNLVESVVKKSRHEAETLKIDTGDV